MQAVPDPEHSEWVRRLRELARLDAEELVPRPAFAVLGLSAPALRPAALIEMAQVNGTWETVTVAYGDWTAPGGPRVTVTTAARGDDAPRQEARAEEAVRRDTEDELLCAIDKERDRVAVAAGAEEEEPAEPPRYTREELPAGTALVCRHGTLWAARLLPGPPGAGGEPGVAVTITGNGVDPESVRLAPTGDLRPYFEARNEILGQLTERRRNLPPPVLPPAEGVAAFRALADHTLASSERSSEARRGRRTHMQPAGWGQLHGALWQRAVREQQRIAGLDRHAADDVVTLVINHLGYLAERAPWFSDRRLRDLAIDETLRHAMLGDDVPSKPAQQAWARYWGARNERLRNLAEADSALADLTARADGPVTQAWLDAWVTWTERA